MAKNGHGGKRAGAGRPPLLPAEAKPERMKGAAGDITLSPARLLLARTEVGLRRRLFQFILDCQIEQRS